MPQQMSRESQVQDSPTSLFTRNLLTGYYRSRRKWACQHLPWERDRHEAKLFSMEADDLASRAAHKMFAEAGTRPAWGILIEEVG
jgi:hypothetical protein